MDISKLKEGMIIKNYKELCELLGEKTKTGTSKISQIKDFERYFSYTKDKHSFIIGTIFKVPLPPSNSVTKYIPLIEKLLMHVIITQSDEKNKLYISKSNLYETLKMVNSEYKSMKYKKLKLSKDYDIPKEIIEDFYDTSDDLLDRNITQALKSLERQSLIKANNVFTVVEQSVNASSTRSGVISKLNYTHREATEFETSLILKLQRELLDELGYRELYEVFTNGKSTEFYNKINEYLLENNNIKYYYNSYELIFNREHIEKAYINFRDYELEEELLEFTSNLLNNNISDKIVDLAISRVNSAKKLTELNKHQLLRVSPDYLNQINELINKLVIN